MRAGGIGASLVAVSLACAAPAWAAEGDLDPTFGIGGRVTTPLGGSSARLRAVTIDSQGRSVAAGVAPFAGSGYDMVIARYLPNGALDTTFSGDGIASFDIPGNGPAERADAVAIDGQGRILAAGCEGTSPGQGTSCDNFALIRVSPDGALDTGFGPAGSGGVSTDFHGEPDSATAVALDSQGRIVVGGTIGFGDNDFGVARYDAGGNPDLTFSGDGKMDVDFTPFASDEDDASAIAIDSQDRIVLAGVSSTPSTNTSFALARLNPDGTRDASFGSNAVPGKAGEVTTPIGDSAFANAVAIDPQGRILAVGSANVGGSSQFALARYNPDGSLDNTFSDDGKATTAIGNSTAEAKGVRFDSHGQALVAGYTGPPLTANLALARYQPNGALDPTFGAGGTATAPTGLVSSLAIDAQDRIVVAHTALNNGSATGFGLARFIGDAVAPTATIGSGPADGALINDPTPTFEFSASEAGGTFACGFDGFSAACTSPVELSTPLGDGPHTFSLTATDRAGNSSAATSRSFTVDTKAPEIEIAGKKKVKTHRKKVRDELTITTSEPAELTCAVDNQPPEACVKKFVTPKLKKGKHLVTVTATDPAGNTSDEDKRIKVVRKKPRK